MSENIIASAEERLAIERWEGEGGSVLVADSLRGPSSDFHRSLPEGANLTSHARSARDRARKPSQ